MPSPTPVEAPHSDWFLFKEIRRAPLQRSAWIPLRSIDEFRKEKSFGDIGYLRDTFACGSLAIPMAHRLLGDALTWSDIGVGHETRSYADSRSYKAVDEYWLDWDKRSATAIELVICQHFGWDDSVWNLNQDVISAFNLRREDDVWVCPDEGYIEVARLIRNSEGQPNRLEMRTEHLRDYLAARQMALRIAWYRDRDAVIETADHISWRKDPPTISEPHYRFEARCHELHEGSGLPFGGKSAMFTSRRTDVFADDDVPEFGPETTENTEADSRTFAHAGRRVFRIEGEIWCEEWIEPASKSTRVRGDTAPSLTSFIVDASGETQTADELNHEDVGRYLWFRPEVIIDILRRRGAVWQWHTRDTGNIELSHGYPVHFGVNRNDLINAYAYDIAKLPEWQRRIWQGFNTSPDGGVSDELLDAQMRVRPARTYAPETHISEAISDVDEQFHIRFGVNLFRSHPSAMAITSAIHRFRALDQQGVFSLAKDVARITVEALNTSELHQIAPPPKGGGGTGSMKSLERVLATIVPQANARQALTRLAGIYELRAADAHLPSERLVDSFKLAGVDPTAPTIQQGLQILLRTMQTLALIHRILELPSDDH